MDLGERLIELREQWLHRSCRHQLIMLGDRWILRMIQLPGIHTIKMLNCNTYNIIQSK